MMASLSIRSSDLEALKLRRVSKRFFNRKILIVSDAWLPQVNGVVRSFQQIQKQLQGWGFEVEMLTPDLFWSVPCPTYPEISLAVGSRRAIRKRLRQRDFDAVHIATEGPLGFSARRVCLKENIPFTTSFHTRFPEYIEARFAIPLRYTDPIQKWFHSASQSTMVTTEALKMELNSKGYQNLKIWTRGVDTQLFHPRWRRATKRAPVFLYVGRVAVEKNIEEFLRLPLPGEKHVVGEGPQKESLTKRYPEVKFLGLKEGPALAEAYASADVFVFPSRTDTFGNVMLEALSSGTPVAAFPVRGPSEVLGKSGAGFLSEDLEAACRQALLVPREICRERALQFSWKESATQFLKNLEWLG